MATREPVLLSKCPVWLQRGQEHFAFFGQIEQLVRSFRCFGITGSQIAHIQSRFQIQFVEVRLSFSPIKSMICFNVNRCCLMVFTSLETWGVTWGVTWGGTSSLTLNNSLLFTLLTRESKFGRLMTTLVPPQKLLTCGMGSPTSLNAS